jgi:DNA-binding NarL/FixJ family response regulator
VLAAEQALFRDGLTSLLEAKWQSCLVFVVEDATDLLRRTQELRPNLVILDLASPAFPGRDVLREVATTAPIAVLWDERHEPDHEALRFLGVWHLIDKRLGAPALLDAVRSILFGAERSSDEVNGRRFGLTQRECQILAAVASAFPNKEIAQRLAITEDTVKRHLTSIFNKVGVSNRVELTLFAVHHGLLDPSAVPERPVTPAKPSPAPRRIIPWREPLVGTR